MKLVTGLRLAQQALFSRKGRDPARYRIAEFLSGLAYPDYKFSEFGRIFLCDREFWQWYRDSVGVDPHSADRKYFLRSLLGLVQHLPGDTAECGVYQGASSYLICAEIEGSGKTHHVFDSFEGLSRPSSVDGDYWREGHLSAPESITRRRLSAFPFIDYHVGWIPSTLAQVEGRTFSFVHIDVDLYEPTYASLAFFYPRMTPGSVLLLDDYGFVTCPGARRAVDRYMQDKLERIIMCPTGQAFIVKR